jgi:hypothetical protein
MGYVRAAASAVTLMSRDGTVGALTSTGTALGAGSPATIMFGAYAGPPPSQPFGNVKEVIYLPYNTEFRPVIEGYLAWKWGLTGLLPSNHPYKTVQP